jgi:hypothetical protein
MISSSDEGSIKHFGVHHANQDLVRRSAAEPVDDAADRLGGDARPRLGGSEDVGTAVDRMGDEALFFQPPQDGLAFCARPVRADDVDRQMRDLPWAEIGATAKRFVDQESPDSVWPFQRETGEALAASPRKVIVHHLPSDPISLDNKPIDADHWAVHYL